MSHDGYFQDDEYEAVAQPEQRNYSWGSRPNFKEMLDGGKNKLVLTMPPDSVVGYFKDKVRNSCGATYDDSLCTFYATTPGGKGRDDGTILAFSGNCDQPPVLVAKGLAATAAIAIYEPGSSVVVVTDRGIFGYKREKNEQGKTISFTSRQITNQDAHRGIAVTAGGNVVSFCNKTGKIRLLDGGVSDGNERVLASVNYVPIINDQLFKDNQSRARSRANCCFMDIVENRLVISDLQKHVISMWEIEETVTGVGSIAFVRAIDVQACEDPMRNRQGSGLTAAQIPLGKCTYPAGIRLDAAGWVMCADADGRTLQIFDNYLNFVTRVDTMAVGALPFISAFCIEANGHLLICDRRNEMGGLRVFILEAKRDDGFLQRLQQEQQQQRAAELLCQMMNQRAPYPNPAPSQYPDRVQPAREEPRPEYGLKVNGYPAGGVNYNSGYNNYNNDSYSNHSYSDYKKNSYNNYGRGNFGGSGGYGRPYGDKDKTRDW